MKEWTSIATYSVSISALSLWGWFVTRSFGDPWPFIFRDEFGKLSGILPSAILLLYILALVQRHLTSPGHMEKFWRWACLALCSPLLMAFPDLARFPGLEILINLAGGLGLAAALLILILNLSLFRRISLLITICLGVFLSAMMVETVLYISPDSLALLPAVLGLLLKILINPETLEKEQSISLQGEGSGFTFIMAVLFALVGFGFGLFYSITAVLEPLLPKPHPLGLLMIGAACTVSGACIYFALYSTLWRALLLAWPILIAGYIAWPLIHRESSALSVEGLSFTYIFTIILPFLTFVYACNRARKHADEIRFTGFIGASLLLGLLLGACALPGVRASFSRGVTVNYIFALLSCINLINCCSCLFMLAKIHFWRPITNQRNNTQNSFPTTDPVHWLEKDVKQINYDRVDFEERFRELGLTRQQALIASMLAVKHSDMDICLSLNISQNTLKTHIRNILKKMNIKSRYELVWLACNNTVQKE